MFYYKVIRSNLTSVGLLGARRIQYKIGEWVYPGEPLSDHPKKGGGLWVVRTGSAAREYRRYVLKEHGIKARIFRCEIGKVLYDTSKIYPTSRRIKTDMVKLVEEVD